MEGASFGLDGCENRQLRGSPLPLVDRLAWFTRGIRSGSFSDRLWGVPVILNILSPTEEEPPGLERRRSHEARAGFVTKCARGVARAVKASPRAAYRLALTALSSPGPSCRGGWRRRCWSSSAFTPSPNTEIVPSLRAGAS